MMPKAPWSPLAVLLDHGGASLNLFLREVVTALRAHLGMRAAFVSRLDGGRRAFRIVDADADERRIVEGASDPEAESYCRHVADGRLPELLTDASQHPFAQTLAATAAFPVGAHLSVPLRLSDGTIYGTLCCFDTRPDQSLGTRDLAVMRAVAAIVCARLDEEADADLRDLALRAKFADTIAASRFSFLGQPICAAGDLAPLGLELFTRFHAFEAASVGSVFADARRCGRDAELTLAILAALAEKLGGDEVADEVFVNVAPHLLLDPEVRAALLLLPCRLVVELTERDAYEVAGPVHAALATLREAGVRVAIDDLGVGYSSLEATLDVNPDFLKIDRSLVKGVAADRRRAAMLRALAGFAKARGGELIAEGVETAEDLECLRELDVGRVQGWFVARPRPI